MSYLYEILSKNLPSQRITTTGCTATGFPNGPCNPGNVSVDEQVVSTQYFSRAVQSNDPDHSRAKPQGLLFKYPTDLPLQYTATNVWTETCFRNFNPWYSCNWPCYGTYGTQLTEVYSRQRAGAVGTDPGTSSLGWELKLRKQLEERLVNVAETLYEWRQTISLAQTVAQQLTKVYRFYRGARKGKFAHANDVPAAWVATTFGIQPLLADLFDASEVLMTRLDEPIYLRLRTKLTQRMQYAVSTAYGDMDGEWKKSQSAVFYVQTDVPGHRISLGSPWELAWELIPFSFIVDWFLPIGEWLGALDAAMRVTGTWGTVTTKRSYLGTDRRRNSNWVASSTYCSSHGIAKSDYHSRKAYWEIPYAPFVAKTKTTASLMKLATAVSLLTILHKSS